MKLPEYAEVNGKRYKINTDYRIALECNKVAQDKTIGDLERALGVIYLLYGEDGINAQDDYEKLLEIGKKYLSCGKEIEKNVKEPDMDYEQDFGLIWASIYSEFNGLDIDKEKIHWWRFMDMLNGLSNSDIGNCCVLNRVRNIRNFDLNSVQDSKLKQQIKEEKERVALKKELTEEQKQSVNQILKDLGIVKEG